MWQAARTGNSPTKLVTLRQKDRHYDTEKENMKSINIENIEI